MTEKPFTRIDLERAGAYGIVVRKWREGWMIADAGAPDSEEYLETGSIPAVLAEYEKQGFTVEMASAAKGRALRGKITRVDVILEGEFWHVRKYPYGWTAKTRPIEVKQFSQVEADAAIEWLRKNNWTLFEFPGGVRAFCGTPYPVRDRAAIVFLRRKFQAERKHFNYDLAFCF
jgi:hypothetical protein